MDRCPDCNTVNDHWRGSVLCLARQEEADRKRQERNKRQRENRKARHDALTGLGLKRVKGALGGTYYE